MASTATATGAPPTASHRSCWRSSPRARRKRTTNEAAPTGMARPVITKATPRATGSHSAKARTASGPSTDDTSPTTAATAMPLAHQRQRGEGSDPVGVRWPASIMATRNVAIRAQPALRIRIEVRRLQADDTSIPPSGSGKASLLAALALAGTTLLLLRLGSGHTAASRRFAARPEFDVWTWAYAAYAAAAAAVGLATLPAFRLLGQATGRGATIRAVAAWPVVGLLILLFGPGELSAHNPLWLQYDRVTVANVVCGIFITPSFAGLLLVQTRLSALRHEILSKVVADRAGGVIVELLWLRAALQRFLVSFGVLVSAGVLAAGALRGALLAD